MLYYWTNKKGQNINLNQASNGDVGNKINQNSTVPEVEIRCKIARTGTVTICFYLEILRGGLPLDFIYICSTQYDFPTKNYLR